MSSAQCSAISTALKAKKYTNAQLATHINTSEQRINEILSGQAKPTQQEFNLIAAALNLTNAPAHAAKVTA